MIRTQPDATGAKAVREKATRYGENIMPIAIEEKSLLSVKECAAKLGISERTLHAHTAPRGTLPCVKIGVRVGYRPETVEQWLCEREGKTEVKPKSKK